MHVPEPNTQELIGKQSFKLRQVRQAEKIQAHAIQSIRAQASKNERREQASAKADTLKQTIAP